ncbi:MAG TPA: hypothetical protein VHM23_28470, partial [Actinomycetota bacterium]|nr:hypothetical protein [Actinomycetota bacterium]
SMGLPRPPGSPIAVPSAMAAVHTGAPSSPAHRQVKLARRHAAQNIPLGHPKGMAGLIGRFMEASPARR